MTRTGSSHLRTNNGVLQTFSVDVKNQVTNSGIFVNYQYDTNGNLSFNQTGSHSSQGYSYDDENRLVNWYSYDDKFDGHGVPASAADLRTEFVYDGRGRLGQRVEYTSDGSVWIAATETRYVYDGWRVIQERDSNNVPTVSYTRGTDLSGSLEGAGGISGLLSRTANSQLPSTNAHAFYHADGNGNITYLVNSSQTLAASYRYDAFEAALAKPRQQIATSSAATQTLSQQFTEADAILNKRLDKLVFQFKDSAPDFFNEYQTARSIVDIRGARKTEKVTPTPTPQPA